MEPPARALVDPLVARGLVADELFDLSLYRELAQVSSGRTRETLEELIPIETRHRAFWEDFFGIRLEALDLGRRVKLRLLVWACRLTGPSGVHLVLEAIEIYGIRKYLALWESAQATTLGPALRGILEDEFRHEDEAVSRLAERKINPARVRGVFLGLNDGLVEILGAVSGFFAAFSDTLTILAAGVTVAVAGAFSMAAGAFVAASSEREVRAIELGKERFLGVRAPAAGGGDDPWAAAIIVGASYLAGATVPLLPVLLGSRGMAASLAASAALAAATSFVLAFLSGMDVRRRIASNLAIMATAVALTYGVGKGWGQISSFQFSPEAKTENWRSDPIPSR